jgi:hypothetical protein
VVVPLFNRFKKGPANLIDGVKYCEFTCALEKLTIIQYARLEIDIDQSLAMCLLEIARNLSILISSLMNAM